MNTKHFRLSIDFAITIAETPPEIDPDTLQGMDPGEYHGYQARLLEALKAHPEALAHWLRSLIARKMMEHGRWDWDDMLMGIAPGAEIDSEAIVAPALAALAEDDQAFFKDRGDCDFADIADLFLASFAVEEKPPVITEVFE